MKIRYLLEGCGAAILILLAYIWPQISPSHIPIYFSVLPITSVTRAILIDLVVLSLAWTLVFAFASTGAENGRIWSIFAAVVITVAVTSMAKIMEAHRFIPKAGILLGTLLTIAAIGSFFVPRIYRAAIAIFRFALMIVGFCILWIAPELLLTALHRQQADVISFHRTDAMDPPQTHRRIIWMLFDELSYAQTFEATNPDLELTNFHSLAKQSFSFSRLTPAGYYTVKVIPSLIIGRQISDLRSNLDGQAVIQVTDNSQWQLLDSQETIFAEARRNGWTTGVAGWSNPYCRLFSSVLDSCFWFPDQFTASYLYSHMSPEKSAIENAVAPLANSIGRLTHRRSQELSSADFHLRDVEGLLRPAEALIRDEQINFVFIHLAIPHPPGVYDRRTQRLARGGSYLDNLALADLYLGKLFDAVHSTRSADNTVMILGSDHSWRLPLWKNAAWWTKEDEEASKIGFDSRPVLIIHFPEQEIGSLVTQPMNSLVVHDAMAKMVRNNSFSAAEFANWILGYEVKDGDAALAKHSQHPKS